jgi:pimeloyl-ACP methyl ester carboxylesterase
MKPARRLPDEMTMNFEYISTNGIRLHTTLEGPEDGEPVFLLHGFPDAWFGWEAQIEPLAESGFKVIVPDQRGYNLSDKPKGVANYQMSLLAADILGLADALGYDRFHLAGHDFGAMVSWNLAMHHPERLKRLAIANVPHPAVMRNYLYSHPKQMLKSWYAFFFQLPKLPEWVAKANNWQFLISAMPDDFTNEEQDRYRKAWNQPGAMTGMINWYRATFRKMGKSAALTQIKTPTLILWGQQDPHLSYEMAPLSAALCEEGRLVTFEDATHWVLHDKSEEVNQYLVEHFSSKD